MATVMASMVMSEILLLLPAQCCADDLHSMDYGLGVDFELRIEEHIET